MSSDLNSTYANIGILILRVGLGAMFIYHGLPKLMGGVHTWDQMGKAMAFTGITFAPAFWGFMAAFAEFFGALALITGLFFRPFCILLTIGMAVAANMHLRTGQGMLAASHAIEDGIVFASLIFIGPGKYAIGSFFRIF